MQTMSDFVRKYGIIAKAGRRGSNPNMAADEEWSRSAHHWHVTLSFQGRRMGIYFSQGSAIHEEPTAADVLNSLALDVSGLQNAGSFEEWCREYGYEIPEEVKGLTKRQAEEFGYEREWEKWQQTKKTYKAIEQEEEKLARFLGSGEIVNELLYETESL